MDGRPQASLGWASLWNIILHLHIHPDQRAELEHVQSQMCITAMVTVKKPQQWRDFLLLWTEMLIHLHLQQHHPRPMYWSVWTLWVNCRPGSTHRPLYLPVDVSRHRYPAVVCLYLDLLLRCHRDFIRSSEIGYIRLPFSALTLLVGRQEGHSACVGLLPVIFWLELLMSIISQVVTAVSINPVWAPGL